MKKLLYFTHVPWNWIKQRPQFLAENLSQRVELSYCQGKSLKSIIRKNDNDDTTNSIPKICYFRVPKYNPITSKSYKILDFINFIFLRFAIKFHEYDYVWVTSIESYERIVNLLPKQTKLIYDCMDDELEFPQVCNNKYARENLASYEKLLISRADFIICSAENLKQQIIKRTNTDKEIFVINNATVFPVSEQNFEYREQFSLNRGKRSMLYIGTIAKWFDFESMLLLLETDPDLICYLIGPVETALPNHNRIVHLGKCIHSEIWGIMRQANILIMPFVLNPLIESVNPVKLYEYIWAEKPIIATRYGESLKFDDYCFLYSSNEELLRLYSDIKESGFLPKQRSSIKIEKFINKNTWDSRCKDIMEIIGIH